MSDQLNSAGISGNCDEVLLAQYTQDVYPFFRSSQTCVGCHIEGGIGLGMFASLNNETSFAAFSAAGITKVAYMATNPQHKPPFTGPQNKPAIDTITSKWSTYQSQYLECQSQSQSGGQNVSLLTSAKKATTIYASGNLTQTLTWDLTAAQDLDANSTRSVPAKISVDVKVLYVTTNNIPYAKGYIFSNPVLQLKDSTKQIVVEGLFFQIGGQPISSQTTYTSLSRVVSGPEPMPLMPNVQANTLIEPISNNDTFQLYLPRILLTSGDDTSPSPLTPILHVSDQTTSNDQIVKAAKVNVLILRDSGISRWCLSESATAPSDAYAPCPSGLTGVGTDNGWLLSRPTSYTVASGDGDKTLYLYVADQNLKINVDPAQVTFKLDTAAPAAPTITSINVTDTQVATLGLTHPNEADVAGWCVLEQNSVKPPPKTPSLTDVCWKWTDNNAKPTTVGFKEGGTRDVWVYVRDQAGNISAASNMMVAQNPFGPITFTQLTDSSGQSGARNIFAARCAACHSSASNPGYNKLKLFDYASALAVVQSGALLSRINNPISPMPNINGGLMPQRDRDLIRLWTLPEQDPNPLP